MDESKSKYLLWIWILADLSFFIAIYILGCVYDGEMELVGRAFAYLCGTVSALSILFLLDRIKK